MKKIDWKAFGKDFAKAYFISLGVCTLVTVIVRRLVGFDVMEQYLEGMVILFAVTISMGLIIFGHFGGTIWNRRLVLWLFSAPLCVMVTGLIMGNDLSMRKLILTGVGYTVGMFLSYLIADAIELRKLKKINEKLEKNQ